MADLFWLTEAQIQRITPTSRSRMGFRGLMTSALSAASFMSSATACAGAMPQPGTVLTRPSTTASSAGAGWACSIGFSPVWPDAEVSRTD
jgi:hypothetical protein